MALKWEIAAAVMASEMPPPSRLIMLVLLDGADADGVIPDRFTPSLTDLTDRTGLGRGTVAARLNDLESGGWVKRDRPTPAEARAGAKTRYALGIGDPKAGLKPKTEETPDSPSPTAGLVREPDQETVEPSPGTGLGVVLEPDQASPGAGPDLVREPDGSTTPQPTFTHQDLSPVAGPDDPTLPIDTEPDPPPPPSRRHRRAYGNPDFDAFWEIYPLRVGPKKAWAAWQKAVKDTEAADIITGAEAYRDDPNRAQAFTKHPTTWLNAGSWDDDPLPPRTTSGHQPYKDPEDMSGYYGDI